MCGKLSFIVHGQRKEKERWAFDDRFFFVLEGIPRLFPVQV